MSEQKQAAWRPWLVFFGCCVLSFVGFGLIVNTPGLYFATLGKELSVSRAQIALASSIMAATGAITMLFAGRIMKRIDSRLLISLCIAATALIFFAQSFFGQLWQFYLSFGLIGIVYVIPISLAPSVLLANWFENKLGMVMGIALGLSGIGGTVFNPIVSSFITTLGWRTSYRITAIIIALCILPFSRFVFKFRPDETRGEVAYGHTAVAVAADDGIPAELPGLTAKQAYRTPAFVLLVVVSGIMFGAAIGKATIGILLDKIHTKFVLALYGLLGLAGWGLMALVVTPTVATLSGFLAGLGQGVVLVALPWLIRKSFGQRDYSEILSIVSMFGAVTSAVAVTLHGMVFDVTGSYVPSLIGNVVLYVIAIGAAIVAYTMRPVATAQQAAKPAVTAAACPVAHVGK